MPSQSQDLSYNALLPVQGSQGPLPVTIASAATIAPSTGVTVITGTTQLVNITPPISGFHVLWFIFPDAMGAMATSGNIAVAADPGVNIPVAMVYNPVTGKYYPGAIS